jgi:hypothetical protein
MGGVRGVRTWLRLASTNRGSFHFAIPQPYHLPLFKERSSHAICDSNETMSSSTLRDSSSSSTRQVSIDASISVDKENSSHKQLILAFGTYFGTMVSYIIEKIN